MIFLKAWMDISHPRFIFSCRWSLVSGFWSMVSGCPPSAFRPQSPNTQIGPLPLYTIAKSPTHLAFP
jgi:hypothetical protein